MLGVRHEDGGKAPPFICRPGCVAAGGARRPIAPGNAVRRAGRAMIARMSWGLAGLGGITGARAVLLLRATGAYVLHAIRRFYYDNGLQAAGALTYTTLLALVPLMTIAFAIFSAFPAFQRSEEHTSELQSLMRHSYAVFFLKK